MVRGITRLNSAWGECRRGVFLFFLPFYVASSVDVSFVMVVHVAVVTGECALIVCACFDHHVHVHARLPPLPPLHSFLPESFRFSSFHDSRGMELFNSIKFILFFLILILFISLFTCLYGSNASNIHLLRVQYP